MKHKILKILFYIILGILVSYLIYPYTSFYYYKPLFIPFSQRLNRTDVILEKGESFKLYVVGVNKRAKFSSTDFKVAYVNLHGKVSAHKIGRAVIRVKVKNKILKCRIRVIELSKNSLTLKMGKKEKVKVRGNVLFVRWKSNNNKVAKINRWGKITAINKGSTNITAKVKDKILKCKIIVE
jgi:uncharacterized protein YjdB